MGGLNSVSQYREDETIQGSGHLVRALGGKSLNEIWAFFFLTASF